MNKFSNKVKTNKNSLKARVVGNDGPTSKIDAGRFITPFKVRNKKNQKLYTVLAVIFSATNNDHHYHVLYSCDENKTLYVREEFEFNQKFEIV